MVGAIWKKWPSIVAMTSLSRLVSCLEACCTFMIAEGRLFVYFLYYFLYMLDISIAAEQNPQVL